MRIMEQFITRIRTNLNGVLEMTQMFDGLMMTGDNLANRIIVELNRDGTPVKITNESEIVGYVIRNDGYTLYIPGEIIEDGNACIDIPAIAYMVSGPLTVAIRMITGDTRVVIATASCYVNLTQTTAIIDPSHTIPDVEEVIAKIEEIEQQEALIQEAEEDRVDAEEARETAEAARASAETSRASAESQRASAESLRNTAEGQRELAETSRSNAETARASAEQGRAAAELLREQTTATTLHKIDGMTVHATGLNPYASPTASITEVTDGQGKTIKHIEFGLAPGDPFVIAKTFASISEMNAYTGTDLRVGQFVLISSTVSDPDNAKMYVVTAVSPSNTFSYVTDLSGVQGIKGDRGYGISSASLDQTNYKLTINFEDGSSYTTPISIRGEKGDTGTSVSSVVQNQDTSITVTLSNGTTYTTDPLKGDTGNGIASASFDQTTYQLTLTYTNGSTYTTPISLRGPTGNTGNGIASTSMDPSTHRLTLTYTDGTTFTTDSLKGEPGSGGASVEYDSQTEALTVIFG